MADSVHFLCLELRSLYNTRKLIDENIFEVELGQINTDATILQYFQHADTSFTRIILSKDKNEFDQIHLNAEEKKLLVEFPSLLEDFEKDFSIAQKILSEKLLPAELRCNKEIIILPDGLLSLIPFEVLKTKNTYLIEQCDVSYAFSYQHLIKMQEQKKRGEVMMCYAPSYQMDENNGSRSVTRSGDKLLDLTYSKNEVDNIHNSFSSALKIKNEEATKANFLKNASKAQVLHIAGHATAREDDNFIYFTNSTDDYALSLSEIYDLDLPAELVTLSACQSGIGKNQISEGVLSLSRGFAYAGAKSVVSTLWNVNDQSTSEIISQFYANLAEGKRKDQALREAKLEYLENRPLNNHPHYWAGLIAVGDMAPIQLRSKARWTLPFTISTLAALIFGASVLRRRKRD